jgi:hypothetical protein
MQDGCAKCRSNPNWNQHGNNPNSIAGLFKLIEELTNENKDMRRVISRQKTEIYSLQQNLSKFLGKDGPSNDPSISHVANPSFNYQNPGFTRGDRSPASPAKVYPGNNVSIRRPVEHNSQTPANNSAKRNRFEEEDVNTSRKRATLWKGESNTPSKVIIVSSEDESPSMKSEVLATVKDIAEKLELVGKGEKASEKMQVSVKENDSVSEAALKYDSTSSVKKSRSNRAVKAVKKIEKRTGWEAWKKVVDTRYEMEEHQEEDYEKFFASFKDENEIEDFVDNGVLKADHIPSEYHELFLREFHDLFVDEDEHESGQNSSNGSGTFKGQRIYPSWKECIRSAYPSYSMPVILEKRVRIGLNDFLKETCPKYNMDYFECVPKGNKSKQYLIPNDVRDDFLMWFQQEKAANAKEVQSLPSGSKKSKRRDSMKNPDSDMVMIDPKYEENTLKPPKWELRPYKE